MSVLATALTRAMTTSGHDLVVLDAETRTWRRHPWPYVHQRAESVAATLLDRDRPGAVGLVGEPTADLVAAIQGAWLAGRAVSILPGPVRGADPRQWARSTLDRFAGAGATAVLSHGPLLALLRDQQPGVLDVTAAADTGRSAAAAPAQPDTPAVLQGTAGSTGVPRTARLSPAAVLANVSGLVEHVGVDPARDVGCSWLPLYHDMGLSFLLSAALTGAPLWLAPTSAFAAAPFRWLSWLHDSAATLTAAPNFAYAVIGKYARRAPEADLSRLRVAINGGEPVDSAALRQFSAGLAGLGFDPAALTPSYGLAEATCAVTAPRPGTGLICDDGHAVLGQPIPGMQVRIQPPPDSDRDGVGEIEIRGTSMMTGYLGEPALNPDGWFPTGDLGYLAAGGLVVCGRAKEIISVAGRNIFPTEIEQVAAGVRGVRDGAVVAFGSDGLRPGLVIAAEFRGPDADGARGELITRVASRCGVVPSQVVFLAPGALPRTSSGKLRRLEVKHNLEALR